MSLSNIFNLLVVLVLFVGCQSTRKKIEGELTKGSASVGQWSAKAMIKSHESGDASIVSLDVLAQQPQPMRVDVTTSMGMALASIVIKEDEIIYIVPKQKKYYQGPVNEEALFPVLKIKVDPKFLSAALFETSYPDWKCSAESGAITDCSTPEGVQLKWERESGVTKTVFINGAKYDVQIQVKSRNIKSQFPDGALSLKIPETYKKYKLK